MMPALVRVETALLNQAVLGTSEKLFVWLQYSVRELSVSIRKKIVATSARVMLPPGWTVPSG